MTRANAKRLVAEAEARLSEYDIVLRRQGDSAANRLDAVERYFRVRDDWESGEGTLPNTDYSDTELSVAAALSAALTTDFVLRRTPDGVAASRPVAVDALRLSNRLASALSAVLEGNPHHDVPRKLHGPLQLLAYASFDLGRALIGYLMTHLAPDVSAGRHEPDAWLSMDETNLVRRRVLASVVTAHRVSLRFRPTGPDGWTHVAREYAQRINAIVQVASIEVGHDAVPDHVHDLGWLNAEEVEEAQALFKKAVGDSEMDEESLGQCLTGRAFLQWIVHGHDQLIEAMTAAADLLRGRNRIGILRTLLGFSEDPEELEQIVVRILAEAGRTLSEDGLRMRAEALPQVLQAVGRIAAKAPERVPALARRVAGWRQDLTFTKGHLWLIPGTPCCFVLEPANGEVVFGELPGLDDRDLIGRMSNDHAEEFENHIDLGTLRRDLTRAIGPLRDLLADQPDGVTSYAFGHLKHLPLGGLTGRGAILAVRPGLHLLSPSPPRRSKDVECKGRIYCVDRSIAQSTSLYTASGTKRVEFNSLEPPGQEAMQSIRALMTARAKELLVFCHGHVDQFHFRQSGLVTGTSDNGVPIVPASSIASQDLCGTELAVVLACGAGQGNVFVEPSLSIGQAFRRAGAKIVIAPQWPILAADACSFSNRFFELVDSGSSYHEAWSEVLRSDPNRFLSIALMEG